MKVHWVPTLAEDISAASGAYLWSVLPDIMNAGPREGHRRLTEHFLTAIDVYIETVETQQLPEPSSQEPKAVPGTSLGIGKAHKPQSTGGPT